VGVDDRRGGQLSPAHGDADASPQPIRQPVRQLPLAPAFEAIGARLLAAETAVDAAAAWRKAKNARQATSAHHRAAHLLKQCEGAATPAIQSLGARALLTPAERETAILAAEGRGNKEIATVQHIAVRTVETRLQSIYSKLGISRRGDLRDGLHS
jgi:DNA-binding NarL/FixJ family response regulator